MSTENYRKLIDQVCNRFGFQATELEYASCNLQINQIPFMLIHGKEEDEDSLYIYCEFGELPDGRKVEAMERLLESNLFLFGNSAPTYGFSPDTNCALLMFRMMISKVTLESVCNVMSRFATQAQIWRRTYFLFEGNLAEADISQVA
jgi:hypothetical protein